MKRYFRCGAPTEQCPHKRTQKILIEGEACCPISNPNCEDYRQQVPLWVAIPHLHPWPFRAIIVLLVAIFVALLLFVFLSPSGWQKRYAEFRAEVENLAHQLADLNSLQSDAKLPQFVSSADFESLRVRNDRLNDEFKRVITAGAKEDAQRIKSEIEALAKDLDKMTAAVDKLSNRTRETSIAAAKLNREYIALEEKIESFQSQLTGRGDIEAIEAFSELLEMIRDGIRRSSLLSMQTNEGGVSSDLLAL